MAIGSIMKGSPRTVHTKDPISPDVAVAAFNEFNVDVWHYPKGSRNGKDDCLSRKVGGLVRFE
jgi:hypothetical protein